MTDTGVRPSRGVVALSHGRRQLFDRALRGARAAAFGPNEFVGQESFMTASDILHLAARAGIRAGTSVLDVCCGVAGPGLLITAETGCGYHGVDVSESAVRLARARFGNRSARIDAAQVPPLPSGSYDVVLLLETLLAFPDKPALLKHVTDALPVGGRFAFTLEEGAPLTEGEWTHMPDADTVWLVPLPVMLSTLHEAGLRVAWQAECTSSHLKVAQRLHAEFVADARSISARIGPDGLDSLLAAHRLWIEWFAAGRVRKFAIVAERADGRAGSGA